MRRAILVVTLIALLVQGWRAVAASASGRHFLDGVTAQRGGAYAAGLASFERARAARVPDPRAWAWSGDAAVLAFDTGTAQETGGERGDALLRRAWEGYAGAVLRCPLDSWSWSGLAEVALRRQERSAAGGTLALDVLARRRALRLEPQGAVALGAAALAVELKPGGFQEIDILGQVHESLGNMDLAHAAYSRSARMMPAPGFHAWGRGRRFAGPLYRAMMAGLDQGVAEAPRFTRALLEWEIGNFALEQEDAPVALVHFQAAERWARYDHEFYHAWSDGGRALERLGRFPEALAWYRKAWEINLVPEEDAMRVATLEAKMGRNREACRDLIVGVRLAPEKEDRRLWAASVCERAGEGRLAQRVLREGIVTPLTHPRLARALLDLQERTGNANSARDTLEGWVRRYPQSAELQRWLEALPAKRPSLP